MARHSQSPGGWILRALRRSSAVSHFGSAWLAVFAFLCVALGDHGEDGVSGRAGEPNALASRSAEKQRKSSRIFIEIWFRSLRGWTHTFWRQSLGQYKTEGQTHRFTAYIKTQQTRRSEWERERQKERWREEGGAERILFQSSQFTLRQSWALEKYRFIFFSLFLFLF